MSRIEKLKRKGCESQSRRAKLSQGFQFQLVPKVLRTRGGELILLILTLIPFMASAQMSESPVGAKYREPVRAPKQYSPKPVQRPVVARRGPASVQARPAVQAPAVVRPSDPIREEQMVPPEPFQPPVVSSFRSLPKQTVRPTRKVASESKPSYDSNDIPTRKIAANTMAAEPVIPRMRTTVSNEERRGNSAPSNWVVSGFYNLAKQTSYTGTTSVQGQNQSYTANESSAPGLGIAGAYVYRPPRGFGFTGQMAFEYGRTATSLTGNAGGRNLSSDYGAGYTTHTLIGAGNGSYAIDRYYFYGGVNYPYVMGSESVQLTGLPGYQVGAGAGLTKNLGMHLEYRMIRMKGSLNMPPTRLEVEEARMPGIILSVDYSL